MVVALGTGAFITSAAALSINANESPAYDLDRQAYETSLEGVRTARVANVEHCDGIPVTNDREFCRTEALATELVRTAEVEQAFRRTEHSARALQRARIDARYQTDRARCGALAGYQREKCLVRAHAARGRALLQASAPYEEKS
jgi:hypothetical protein